MSWLLALTLANATERRTPVVLAVEKAAPAVVAIETEMTVVNPFPFWGPDTYKTGSQGSGVVIDDDGVILTNAHVVIGAETITVHMADGTEHLAELVGMEPDLDLAVLRVDADSLPEIELGSSADLFLGESVIAIGNPYGLGQTVSTGVVSHVGREVELQPGIVQDYVQTDAAINPGNSGGALINLDGQLIGINTAVHAQAEGIGFAIPVDRAHKAAMDLMLYGTVQVPWLGMDLTDISRRRLYDTPLAEGAVLVTTIHPDSPAAAAGLEQGDLVYKADGRAIHSRADLNAYLSQSRTGRKVELSIYRGTRPLELVVKTAELPEGFIETLVDDVLGADMKLEGAGVVVTDVRDGGAFSNAGLESGDIIVAVNGTAIRHLEDLRKALGEAKGEHRPSATFTIDRAGTRGSVTLPI
jgi:serine protease Do